MGTGRDLIRCVRTEASYNGSRALLTRMNQQLSRSASLNVPRGEVVYRCRAYRFASNPFWSAARRGGHQIEFAIERTIAKQSEESGCTAMKGKKVLLVEDDTDAAHAMAVRLKAKEFTVAMGPDTIAARCSAQRKAGFDYPRPRTAWRRWLRGHAAPEGQCRTNADSSYRREYPRSAPQRAPRH